MRSLQKIALITLFVSFLMILSSPVAYGQNKGTFTCGMSGSKCAVTANNCNSAGGFAPSPKVCDDATTFGTTFCNGLGPQVCVTNPQPASGAGGVVTADIKGQCPNENDIETGIGCIPIGDLNSFSAFFLRWGLGLAGGIAILMLIYSSFLLMTSAGDPKRTQVGRELLTSAISGIILLVFSVFVLRLLGITILGIL